MRSELRSAAVIARITTLEAIRNKLLLVGLVFGVVLIALSLSAAAIAVGEKSRLICDVGLAAASAIGSIMTIALMVTSFSGELTKHTAYPVLARPIPRWAFILGKYVGVVVAMSAVVGVMILATAGTVAAYGDTPPAALWMQLPLALVEVALVASLALVFSTLATPALASCYSGGIVIAGNLAEQILEIARAKLHNDDSSGHILEGLYYILPDIQSLSVRSAAANTLLPPPGYVASGIGYGLCYAAMVVLLAMVIFERRKAV
ncbi:MAG: ABC transporter permease [Clostridia bacterium]|nr:ABC transporter permease [Deltaproteobacteria bacterium]